MKIKNIEIDWYNVATIALIIFMFWFLGCGDNDERLTDEWQTETSDAGTNRGFGGTNQGGISGRFDASQAGQTGQTIVMDGSSDVGVDSRVNMGGSNGTVTPDAGPVNECWVNGDPTQGPACFNIQFPPGVCSDVPCDSPSIYLFKCSNCPEK